MPFAEPEYAFLRSWMGRPLFLTTRVLDNVERSLFTDCSKRFTRSMHEKNAVKKALNNNDLQLPLLATGFVYTDPGLYHQNDIVNHMIKCSAALYLRLVNFALVFQNISFGKFIFVIVFDS